MSDPNTIFVVDPDPAMRSVIEEIAYAMEVPTAFFNNAEAFVQSYPENASGCIVSEFRLRGMNGIELQEVVVARRHPLPMIFVTAYAETPITVRAVRAGAITVLEKPFSRQDLWDSLRTGLTLDQQIRRIDDQHQRVRRRLSQLTAKERQVLDLIMEGKANKQIATHLAVSVRTVEARRHQIFKKVGAESVAELVQMIVRLDCE